MDGAEGRGAAEARSRVAFLDWLRIFAFASVLCGHVYSEEYVALMRSSGIDASLRAVMAFLYPLIQSGGAGVVVFFLVSGYVITRVLMREDARTFVIRRVFRIYPLYVLAVLIHCALAPRPWSVLLLQLTLLGDWTHTPHALNGVEWTLRVEILFYAVMALAKAAGLINGARARFFPVALMFVMGLLWMLPPQPGRWAWCYGYLNLYGAFLLLGSYVFLLEQGRVRAWSCAAFGAAVIAAYRAHIGVWQPAYTNVHFAEAAVALFLLAWLLRNRIFIGRIGSATSELTYAVYLFHLWLFPLLIAFGLRMTGNIAAANIFALALLFTICRLVTVFVERPAIEMGRRFARRIVRSPATDTTLAT